MVFIFLLKKKAAFAFTFLEFRSPAACSCSDPDLRRRKLGAEYGSKYRTGPGGLPFIAVNTRAKLARAAPAVNMPSQPACCYPPPPPLSEAGDIFLSLRDRVEVLILTSY